MKPYNIELLQKHLPSMNVKTPEQIANQSTNGLLTYYKSLHRYTTYGGYCSCCGESYISMKGTEQDEILQSQVDSAFYEYKKYIKEQLNTREHIEKKVQKENPNRKTILLRNFIKNEKLFDMSKKDLHDYFQGKHERSGYFFYSDKRFPFGHSFKEVSKLCELIKLSKSPRKTES
mgnify:CR=1 FL=1